MKKFWTKNYPSGINNNLNLNQYNSFVDLFNEGFKKYPNEIAFENMGKSITFKELDQGLRDSDTARKDAIELRKKGRPSGGIGYTLSNETLEKRIGIASDIVFQRKGRANFKDTEIQKVRESVDSFLRKPTMF